MVPVPHTGAMTAVEQLVDDFRKMAAQAKIDAEAEWVSQYANEDYARAQISATGQTFAFAAEMLVDAIDSDKEAAKDEPSEDER